MLTALNEILKKKYLLNISKLKLLCATDAGEKVF